MNKLICTVYNIKINKTIALSILNTNIVFIYL